MKVDVAGPTRTSRTPALGAHNPKVAGSNPAPATIAVSKAQVVDLGFRRCRGVPPSSAHRPSDRTFGDFYTDFYTRASVFPCGSRDRRVRGPTLAPRRRPRLGAHVLHAGREDAVVTQSVPLVFDVPGRVLHCPMVVATIAGCATKLIVDTGATSHLLTMEFVERAGLDAVATAPGRDVAGDSVAGWSVGDVDAELGSLRSTLQQVVAIDGPDPFHEWGIAGFLSPQRLVEDAPIVLDLADARLYVEDVDAEEISARLRHRVGEFVPLEGAQHIAGTLGVQLRVLPAEPVVAFLDTGAAETEVAAAAVEGVADGPCVRAARVSAVPRSTSGVSRTSSLRSGALDSGLYATKRG